jgi:hypothetical protein
LRGQDSYTELKKSKRRYPRNHVKAFYYGDVWQVDILDLQPFVSENDGYKYLLVGVDTYSKYLSTWPLKDRKPDSVLYALQKMISDLPFEIKTIYWDEEGSFLSKLVQNWLKGAKIINYTTTSSVKAPNVERMNRQLRMAFAKYFKATTTVRWLDYVELFALNYNNRKHGTTKRRPLDLIADPTLIPQKQPKPKPLGKLPPVGAYVRLSKRKGTFGKEASGTWTEEVFRVEKHTRNVPVPMATVQDLLGERILGSFYPQELQQIEWIVGEKKPQYIFGTRMKNGQKQRLVSFYGYPSKYREWI